MKPEEKRLINRDKILEYVKKLEEAVYNLEHLPPMPRPKFGYFSKDKTTEKWSLPTSPPEFLPTATSPSNWGIPDETSLRKHLNDAINYFRMLEELDPFHSKFPEYDKIRKAVEKVEWRAPFFSAFRSAERDVIKTLIASTPIYLSSIKRSLPPIQEQRVESTQATVQSPEYRVVPQVKPRIPDSLSNLEKVGRRLFETLGTTKQKSELPLVKPEEILTIPLIPRSTADLMSTAVVYASEGGRIADVVNYVEKAREIINRAGDVDPKLTEVYEQVGRMLHLPNLDVTMQVRDDHTLYNKIIEASVRTKIWLGRKGIDTTFLEHVLSTYSD